MLGKGVDEGERSMDDGVGREGGLRKLNQTENEFSKTVRQVTHSAQIIT